MSTTTATTLLQLAGAAPRSPRWENATLILIDAQNEYVDGKLPLSGIAEAVNAARGLLDAARTNGTPVIHIVHRAPAESPLFANGSSAAAIIPALSPIAGETVIAKTLPNAFAGTGLADELARIASTLGRREIIVAGFTTHMCVSTTAPAALDRGIPATVVSDATATRDLPDAEGDVVPAAVVRRAAIAAIADRFATIVTTPALLQKP